MWDKTLGKTAGKLEIINVALKGLHVWMRTDVSISLFAYVGESLVAVSRSKSQTMMCFTLTWSSEIIFSSSLINLSSLAFHTGRRTIGTESMESTVLSFSYENDEVNTDEYKPIQMCQLWPQWSYSLQLSSRTVVKKMTVYIYEVLSMISSTAGKVAFLLE